MAIRFDKRFLEVFNSDKPYIKSWLVAWDYQVKRKKRNIKYKDELPSDFFSYNGPEDLVKWMNWFSPVYPDYYGESLTRPLSLESMENDKKILSTLRLHFDFSNYHKNIGLNNAHDFLIPTLYPVPEKNQIKNILDFGAGYGRQANLWSTKIKDGIYVGMDAIPNSYTLQNLYYTHLTPSVFDYVDDPKNFQFDLQKKGIYHIPTWRYDLLPDSSFDMVMCVQVLPELNAKLVSTMLNQFLRILKPGGMLYLRDHACIWKPTDKMDTDSFLLNHGFVLEFKPHIRLDHDLHGIPRIFRKIDPEVTTSQKYSFERRKKQWIEDIDSLSGGSLKKLVRKIKK